MNNNDELKFGRLLNPEIATLHREYFKEMVSLIGVFTVYRAPKPGRTYTTYAEIDTNYENPIQVGGIFEEEPNQKTLKTLGWVSELQEGASIFHVPYDTKGLQRGALFTIPSGIDRAKGRLFKVNKISNMMIYPYSFACEIVPEFDSEYVGPKLNYQDSSFTLLNTEDE